MSLANIRTSVKTGLETLSAFKHVYATAPESVNEFPAAIIKPASGGKQESFAGEISHNFEVLILVGLQGSWDASQTTLDALLDTTGLQAAIEGRKSALISSGDASDLQYQGYDRYGIIPYNKVEYWGCIAKFQVWI